MAARVTIGGADHLADLNQAQPITIDLLQNGRSRLRFTCLPTYEPARFAEVVCYAQDGTTPIYGGLILQRRMEGLVPASVPAQMTCEAVGFEAYLDWAYLDLSYVTDTNLQVVLEDLVAALPAAYGITLDAADYSGTFLAAFTWSTMRASDGLRELCERTGQVYRVSPGKVLSVTLPGGLVAPGDLTDATPNAKEITWQDAATPATTTVKLICGGSGTAWVLQSWVQAGLATSWLADLPAAGPTAGYVTVGGIFLTLGLPGDEAAASYIWTAATRTLSLGTASAPANGTVITLSYLVQYPFTVTATTGGTPDIQVVYTRSDVFDLAQAQEIADGLLSAQGGSPRSLEFTSLLEGWAPGQAVTVDIAGRSVDAVFALTDVTIDWQTPGFWLYTGRATELSVFPGNYLDQWRALLAGSSSGATTVGSSSGVVSTGGGAPPAYYLGGSRFHAVQAPVIEE